MCCLRENILTLRLSVGGRTDARTDGRTENIYSIFRDKLLLLGEHGQDQDAGLQQSATRHPERYTRKDINTVTNVLCYIKPNDDPSNWKITLPDDLIEPTIQWYHQITGHPGSRRLYEHIRQRYYNRDMRKHIDRFNCDYCQKNKLEGRGYGQLPEQEVRSIPFEERAVDLIGPWIIQVCGNPCEFNALTVIDTVTNLVELVRIDQKTSDDVTRKYAQCW